MIGMDSVMDADYSQSDSDGYFGFELCRISNLHGWSDSVLTRTLIQSEAMAVNTVEAMAVPAPITANIIPHKSLSTSNQFEI